MDREKEVSRVFDAIMFGGYKSFLPDEDVIIPKLENITVFIGKNNSGKSSILDVIGAACNTEYYWDLQNKPLKMVLGYTISESMLKQVLSNRYGESSYFYGIRKYVGETLWLDLVISSPFSRDRVRFERKCNDLLNSSINGCYTDWPQYARELDRKGSAHFKRIAAERNIVPEKASNAVKLFPDGSGATNMIRKIINDGKQEESLIEITLLSALNEIMGSDAQFESIRVQEIGYGKDASETMWEVYLQEKGNRRFPLSQSGSGLKTIILVLLNLLILPEIEPGNQSEYVFGFEELENNLHPALQRRLYDFIYNYSLKTTRRILLTTHSHVAINMLYEREHTALYHVEKPGLASTVHLVEDYLDKAKILDDLDVKASDLLQANGIVWVEGPSDRVYIKRWLEVFGGSDVQEGRDYQFAYYGGRLLSHYSADEDTKDLINVLLINRNSAIVIDSDKRYRNDSINNTKKRVEAEFHRYGLFSWITKGKEIENYIAVNAINKALSEQLPEQCEQYKLFPDYIESVYGGFSSKKVIFANQVKAHIDTTPVLDLEEKIKKLYNTIMSWNK